jgi:hypothetical protein
MYKLYRYSIVYRLYDEKNKKVLKAEKSIYSMYFISFMVCRREALAIMRAPVPSSIETILVNKHKGCKAFASAYTVESLFVDDTTYDELLNNHALKGVVF